MRCIGIQGLRDKNHSLPQRKGHNITANDDVVVAKSVNVYVHVYGYSDDDDDNDAGAALENIFAIKFNWKFLVWKYDVENVLKSCMKAYFVDIVNKCLLPEYSQEYAVEYTGVRPTHSCMLCGLSTRSKALHQNSMMTGYNTRGSNEMKYTELFQNPITWYIITKFIGGRGGW